MSNVQVLNLTTIETVESKLLRMKALKESIKALDAELKMLQDEVINDYFVDNTEYKTSKGLLLASYKSQDRNQFNSSKFKEDHEDIYSMYSEVKTIRVFLLK
jgi:hypothetical protein